MRTKKINILIVDDNPEGLLALEAVLTNPEYNLVKAHSGEEALAQVLRYDFSLILMDVQMPGLDGFETVRVIKQRDRSRDIPVIFLTAISIDSAYIHKGYGAGAVDYIFKPFDSEVLKSKVNVLVELHQKRIQLKEQSELLRQSEVRERMRQISAIQLESFNRYRHLADAIPHIVWKFDADSRLEYCNQFWTSFSGLSLNESFCDGWLESVHPDDIPPLNEKWAKARAGKSAFDTEVRLRPKGSEVFRYHMFRAVPEFDIADGLRSWIVTNTDIDDRKKIEVDLRRARDESNAANEAKTNFLATMSHEIRTPLGAVLGFAELMANPDQSKEDRQMCLDTIRRNGELLSQLIGDILDLSKIEAGKVEIEKVQFSIADLVTTVVHSMGHAAKAKDIDLKMKLEHSIPSSVDSDPTRVRQILFNIVGNAVKFTDKGSVEVCVGMIERDGPAAKMMIRVTDEGTGITDDQADKLFQPFIQADNSTTRKYGGTGLGLSLSRRLARQLGGDVQLLESRPEKGSAFLITFAVGDIENVPMIDSLPSQGARKMRSDEKIPNLHGVNVLLVEDSPDNQSLIKSFLKPTGVNIDLAVNGSEGVDKALGKEYDLILMDIQMPVLDGYRATKQLREKGMHKPIIALTAYALKEERERCLASGCNDHLTKPINRMELIKQVAKHASMSMRAPEVSAQL